MNYCTTFLLEKTTALDFGKSFPANWSFSVTQFTPENVRVQNGRLYLRINRGNPGNSAPAPTPSPDSNAVENLARNGSASQSSTSHSGDASRAIDGDTNGRWKDGSVTHTSSSSNSSWQVRLAQTNTINNINRSGRTVRVSLNGTLSLAEVEVMGTPN